MSSFIRNPIHLIFLLSFFVILLSLKFTIIYEYEAIVFIITFVYYNASESILKNIKYALTYYNEHK